MHAMRHATLKTILLLATISAYVRSSELNKHAEPVEVEVSATGNLKRDPRDKFIDRNTHKDSITPNYAKPKENSEPFIKKQQEHGEDSQSWSQASYLITLERELEEVDQLIALQRRKVAALERLRTQLLVSTDNLVSKDVNRAIDHRLQEVTADHVQTLSRFDSHFIEWAQISLNQDDVLVDIQIEALKQPHSNSDLIVLGYRSGDIVVYSTSPQPTELCRIERMVDNTNLVSFQLDVVSDTPLLAAAYKSQDSATSIVLYRLSLLRNDTMYTILHRFQPGQEVTALSFARQSRRSVLATANADGTLAFYATNGTVIHRVDVEAGYPIRIIAMRNNFVAFANGTATVLYALSRQQIHPSTFQVCTGSLAMVTSIGFDPINADILFIGTADGEILVFSLATSSGERRTCTLVHRVIVKRTSSLSLQVLDGYVIATTNDRLSVFNVSTTSATTTLKLVCSIPASSNTQHQPILFSITRGTLTSTLGLITATPSVQPYVTLYQSLLPSQSNIDGGSGFDTSTLRGLWFVCMIAATVAITQWYSRRDHANRAPWRDVSCKSGLSTDQEAARWMEYLEKRHQNGMDSNTNFSSSPNSRSASSRNKFPPEHFSAEDTRQLLAGHKSYSRSKPSKSMYDYSSHDLRHEIAKARRENLECTFDDDLVG